MIVVQNNRSVNYTSFGRSGFRGPALPHADRVPALLGYTRPMSRKKRVVGTAGHIDHGKTALVLALTGTDTDRLPEEKRRGITIDLGFASWFTDDYQIGFIDVPGH